jgi:hypothetical protein
VVGVSGLNNVVNGTLDNTAGVSAGGPGATLNVGDSIAGGGLSTTLNIADSGLGATMVLPAATVSGITALNISSNQGVGTQDFSGWAGLAQVNVRASSGATAITVGPNTVLTIVDNGGTGAIATTGGSTVAITASASHAVTVTGGSATTAVSVTGGTAVLIADGNYATAGANTLASVTLADSGQSVLGSNITIDSNALTSLTMNGTDSNVTVNAAAGTRTLNVTLTGVDVGGVTDATATTAAITATPVVGSALTFNFASATTIDYDAIASAASTAPGASYAQTFLGANVTSFVITGAGNFEGDMHGLNAAAAISAAGSSGVASVALASASGGAPTQTFAGGAGRDIVTVGAGQTGTVTGGTATNNEIVLDNVAAATYAALSPYAHFSVLGVAGTTSGTFDMSRVTGYTAFDVQGVGGNVTFTNAASGSSLSIEGSIAASEYITLQTIDTTGAYDTAFVKLNVTGGAAITVNEIVLEDANFVGTSTLDMVVNANSTITTIGDYNLTTLNISGAGALTVGANINDVASSVTINNSAGASVIAGLTDNYLTSLTIGGSTPLQLNGLHSNVAALIITDNDGGAFLLNGFTDASLTTATFTNSVNTSAGVFTVGGNLSETALATLNLNGNVGINVTDDAVTTGITIMGGTDSANVSFTTIGITATGAADHITLANGSDNVTLGGGAAGSAHYVTLGNGNDTVTDYTLGTAAISVGGTAGGTDAIAANTAASININSGNGNTQVSATATGATGFVTVGSGTDTVRLGANAAVTVAIASHSGSDAIIVGASGSSLTNIVQISGLNNASTDTIQFASDANNLAAFTQVTSGNVVGSGGNTTLLASWVAAADGLATISGGGSSMTGAAHTVTWFQFLGNTYVLESVAGQTADAGTMASGNTLVELIGTGYTFAHVTGAGGVLHLNG